MNEVDKKAKKHNITCHGASDAIYGLGMIGAAYYFVTTATGFWVGVLGIIKAFFWPAFVVYEVLKYFKM